MDKDKTARTGRKVARGARRKRRKAASPLTWSQTVGLVIDPAIEDARVWWDALGHYDRLQQDIAEKRTELLLLGALPPQPELKVIEVPDDVPAAVRAVSAALLRKYPRLTLYTPGLYSREIWTYLLQHSWDEALCTNWEQGGKQLELQIRRWTLLRSLATWAEVWNARWVSNESITSSHTDVLGAEETHPVLVEPLYRDPAPVHVGVDLPVILVPYSPAQTSEQFWETVKRARHKAAQSVASQDESGALRRRPGVKKDYHTMVELYQAWDQAGRPKQRGRVTRGKKYSKELLGQAIEWLDPEVVEDIPLDN